MTADNSSNIKFKRYADDYMCKEYFYRLYNSDESFNRLQMTEYEFKQLFKDMALELGYDIIQKKKETMSNETDKFDLTFTRHELEELRRGLKVAWGEGQTINRAQNEELIIRIYDILDDDSNGMKQFFQNELTKKIINDMNKRRR